MSTEVSLVTRVVVPHARQSIHKSARPKVTRSGDEPRQEVDGAPAFQDFNPYHLIFRTLRKLWDEVKHRLRSSARKMSGGQQQRLCIARAIATQPEVILMDEPCSALDPIATTRIEDLMQDLKADYTIDIVTHTMQQAARVSDNTAFFWAEVNPESYTGTGVLVEFDDTQRIFTMSWDIRTERYMFVRAS